MAPTASDVKVNPPLAIGPGTARSVVVPSPSCPKPLLPQQRVWPPRISQLVLPPALRVVTIGATPVAVAVNTAEGMPLTVAVNDCWPTVRPSVAPVRATPCASLVAWRCPRCRRRS